MKLFKTKSSIAGLLSVAWFIVAALADAATPPSLWSSRGIGGGGAFFGASFSPYNANELYIGCDMSDLFHSTDLGASWNTVDFRQIVSFHSTKVNFTSDANTLYTVDYASNNGTSSARPKKSTDGGATWSYLSNWGSGTGTNRVFYLFADPGSVTNLIVTTETDLYFSNDGGNTFTSKYTDGTNNGLTIGGVFWNGQNIYVGTNAGLLVSNNGGGSFSLSSVGGIPVSEAIFSMAGAKTGSTVRLFALTVSATAEVLGTRTDPLYSNDVYGHFSSVYKLDIGSPNWVPAVSGITAGDQPVLVTMALNDINTVYLGGRIGGNSARVVYKTSDAGTNWTSVFLTNNNQNIYNGWGGQGGDLGGTWWVGPILHDIAAAPNNSNKVITTDQDGLTYLTADGGATWHQVYTDPTAQYPPGSPTAHQHKYYSGNGHEPTVAWWIVWLDSNNMFAAFADITAIRSKDSGSSWSFDWTGLNFGSNYMADTYHFVKHPSSGALYAAQSNGHGMIYQAVCLTDACIDNTAGGLRFSTDNGQNWTGMTNLTNPVLWLAIDPNTTTRMYAAVANSTSGGIYMSNNFQTGASATWTKLNSPTRTEGHPQNIFILNDGNLLATFSARINGSNLFTKSSGVFISSDGGTTWIDRSDPKMTYYTRHLTIDPTDSTQNTWYVGTYGDWGMGSSNISGGLFKTSDRGQHWSQIYSGDGVESITVNPTNTDELYVATSRSGLLYSNNATSSTPTFTQLSAYPFSRPARIFFNPYDNDEIWVTSAGNGLRAGRVGHALSVNNKGTGSGTVTSSPAGISCGSGCSSTFTSGTSVTLTANADSGSTFSSWTGCDSASGNTCTVSITAAKSVTATFTVSASISHTLTGPSTTTVSRGATFGPIASLITNNTNSSYSLYLYAAVYTPTGSWVDTVASPITLSAGQTVSNNITRLIPALADAGTYYFCEGVYDTSWIVIDSKCVNFTVH
ncbi:MAG: hypothetical protein HQL08_04330 [Nitrospirae bacterium]|nr:hypothetical protein [Nitrospirota bacterium]